MEGGPPDLDSHGPALVRDAGLSGVYPDYVRPGGVSPRLHRSDHLALHRGRRGERPDRRPPLRPDRLQTDLLRIVHSVNPRPFADALYAGLLDLCGGCAGGFFPVRLHSAGSRHGTEAGAPRQVDGVEPDDGARHGVGGHVDTHRREPRRSLLHPDGARGRGRDLDFSVSVSSTSSPRSASGSSPPAGDRECNAPMRRRLQPETG